MIISFGDRLTEDVYNGVENKRTRKIELSVRERAQNRMDLIDQAQHINDLLDPPSNRLEKLRGNLADFWSIRVNNRWRLIFVWDELNANASLVTLTDYH